MALCFRLPLLYPHAFDPSLVNPDARPSVSCAPSPLRPRSLLGRPCPPAKPRHCFLPGALVWELQPCPRARVSDAGPQKALLVRAFSSPFVPLILPHFSRFPHVLASFSTHVLPPLLPLSVLLTLNSNCRRWAESRRDGADHGACYVPSSGRCDLDMRRQPFPGTSAHLSEFGLVQRTSFPRTTALFRFWPSASGEHGTPFGALGSIAKGRWS